MGKKLIITEKPSVAQQFANTLGNFNRKDGYLENEEYVITWCVGHLIQMSYPEKYDSQLKKWALRTLPFLPDKYLYEVIPDVKKQYNIVKTQLNRSDIDVIYNAGDSGREGEYIQRLVYQMAGHNKNALMKRIWIDSQTEEAIRNGIRDAKPANEYDSLSDAAYARAIEDYVIGINFSRALSIVFGGDFNKTIKSSKYVPISVGRVMTCVLGMVEEREIKIREFKPTSYYGIEANCGFICKWKVFEGSKFYENPILYNDTGFKELKHAKTLLDIFNSKKVILIEQVKRKKETKKAPLLYNLAELQNDCSQKFKISPDKTLEVVQKLYEQKLTTYPRTDARVLSTAAAKEVSKNLTNLQKGDYKLEEIETILQNNWYNGIEKTIYCDDSKVTDHYAIIPTGQTQTEGLSELELNIYKLIVNRFISIFYPPAEYEKVEVIAKHPTKEKFVASEKILVKPGYLDVIGYKPDAMQSTLSSVKENDILPTTFSIKEGQTTPPKRYTTGNLILAMENAGNLIEDEELRAQIKGSGIGTAATRADTIKKLEKIGYIAVNSKTQIVTPHPIGEAVYQIVKEHVPNLLSPKMTASWEKGLSQIVERNISEKEYMEKLYTYVKTTVEQIKAQDSRGSLNGHDENEPETETQLEEKCPLCNGDMFLNEYGCKCSNEECQFYIPKHMYETAVKEEQLNKLLTEGKTDIVNSFVSKKGYNYSAYLIIDKDEKKVVMNMPERHAEITTFSCPKCKKKKLFRYEKTLECHCGFKTYHTLCKKEFSDEELEQLLNGETVRISGLYSEKKNKSFTANIAMKKNGNLEFK